MKIKDMIKNEIFVLDGAMGTMLQAAGLKNGENPEILNITAPETVALINEKYFAAGSKMVMANTFGSNRLKLERTGYTVSHVIKKGIEIAKTAAIKYDGFVALDIGSLGELLEPMGTLKFETAYEMFKEQIIAGAEAGADAVVIETMTDLYEMKCAVLAAKENCNLPVLATMSFEQNMRTFSGTSISAMALTLEDLGVDALGINCSLGPVEIYPMVEELIKWTNLPIIVKPNAGLPTVINGETTFNITKEQFAEEIEKITQLGVNIIGGCCGTNPEYIELISKIKTFKTRTTVKTSAVCTSSATVVIDDNTEFAECIDKTNANALRKEILSEDYDSLIDIAMEKISDGADILSINLDILGISEKKVISDLIKGFQALIRTPLKIVCSDNELLKSVKRVYNGKL